MIANVNPRGHSFMGVTAYLMHDKGSSDSSDRVVQTSTHNLHTEDVDRAARFMAWTDSNHEEIKSVAGTSSAGVKAQRGNVYHYSLSWEPGSDVGWDHMQETALSSVRRLGLQEHQIYLVAHNDTKHPHVHVVANLVNPDTGINRQQLPGSEQTGQMGQ